MPYLYLHQGQKGTWTLDPDLNPEVRERLLDLVDRFPEGGLHARYTELVDAVHAHLRPVATVIAAAFQVSGEELHTSSRDAAERTLCMYPIYPQAKRFFDDYPSTDERTP